MSVTMQPQPDQSAAQAPLPTKIIGNRGQTLGAFQKQGSAWFGVARYAATGDSHGELTTAGQKAVAVFAGIIDVIINLTVLPTIYKFFNNRSVEQHNAQSVHERASASVKEKLDTVMSKAKSFHDGIMMGVTTLEKQSFRDAIDGLGMVYDEADLLPAAERKAVHAMLDQMIDDRIAAECGDKEVVVFGGQIRLADLIRNGYKDVRDFKLPGNMEEAFEYGVHTKSPTRIVKAFFRQAGSPQADLGVALKNLRDNLNNFKLASGNKQREKDLRESIRRQIRDTFKNPNSKEYQNVVRGAAQYILNNTGDLPNPFTTDYQGLVSKMIKDRLMDAKNKRPFLEKVQEKVTELAQAANRHLGEESLIRGGINLALGGVGGYGIYRLYQAGIFGTIAEVAKRAFDAAYDFITNPSFEKIKQAAAAAEKYVRDHIPPVPEIPDTGFIAAATKAFNTAKDGVYNAGVAVGNGLYNAGTAVVGGATTAAVAVKNGAVAVGQFAYANGPSKEFVAGAAVLGVAGYAAYKGYKYVAGALSAPLPPGAKELAQVNNELKKAKREKNEANAIRASLPTHPKAQKAIDSANDAQRVAADAEDKAGRSLADAKTARAAANKAHKEARTVRTDNGRQVWVIDPVKEKAAKKAEQVANQKMKVARKDAAEAVKKAEHAKKKAVGAQAAVVKAQKEDLDSILRDIQNRLNALQGQLSEVDLKKEAEKMRAQLNKELKKIQAVRENLEKFKIPNIRNELTIVEQKLNVLQDRLYDGHSPHLQDAVDSCYDQVVSLKNEQKRLEAELKALKGKEEKIQKQMEQISTKFHLPAISNSWFW